MLRRRHERQRDGQRVRVGQLGHDLLLALYLRNPHAWTKVREQAQLLTPVHCATFLHDTGACHGVQKGADKEEKLFFT